MTQLKIEYVAPGALTANPDNARVHGQRQIGQIARSIDRFGFNCPVVINDENQLLVGHGRWLGAQKLGLALIPAVRVSHLSEGQRQAFVIADNRLAELSDWNGDVLAAELEKLQVLNLGFEITDTGFEIAEIDLIIEEAREQKPDSADQEIDIDRIEPVARRGDLWQLGRHRLFCGDALDRQSYEIALGALRAQMVFTDPPYNVKIGGHVSGLGKAQHREFAMASGEMSQSEFTQFLTTTFERLIEFSTDGSIHYVCMDWRHMGELLAAGSATYAEQKNLIAWVKAQGGMGSMYRSKHELIGVFKAGRAPHINHVQLGKYGRNRTNVWEYPGMNSFQKNRGRKLAWHPTVKPVALVADAMLDCSDPGGIVLDPYCGSGTTLLAAERANRIGVGIELDPHYVDVTLRRFCDATGIEPVNVFTGARVARTAKPARRKAEEASGER